MICEDRELLADLYRLNTDLPALALRIIDGNAGAAEQLDYAQRLTRARQQLQQQAARINMTVIDGTVIILIPMHVESAEEREQDL